jgi:hypothetical protein
MMGRAGRPQYDRHGVAVIMVHEPKKQFYKRFLYEPFPVESSLPDQVADHFNAEAVAGTIASKQDAVDYLTWTYFFRRLLQNPSYYDLAVGGGRGSRGGGGGRGAGLQAPASQEGVGGGGPERDGFKTYTPLPAPLLLQDTGHESINAFLSNLVEAALAALQDAGGARAAHLHPCPAHPGTAAERAAAGAAVHAAGPAPARRRGAGRCKLAAASWSFARLRQGASSWTRRRGRSALRGWGGLRRSTTCGTPPPPSWARRCAAAAWA